MFFNFDEYSYYIRPGATDSRKSWYALSLLVDGEMNLSSRDKAMFLFCNKAHNSIKILVWDNGYWVLHKRLERGTFAWPERKEDALRITLEDIKRLLNGEDVFRRIPVQSREIIY